MNLKKLSQLRQAIKLLDELIASSLSGESLTDDSFTINEKGERIIKPEVLEKLDKLKQSNDKLKAFEKSETKEDDK